MFGLRFFMPVPGLTYFTKSALMFRLLSNHLHGIKKGGYFAIETIYRA